MSCSWSLDGRKANRSIKIWRWTCPILTSPWYQASITIRLKPQLWEATWVPTLGRLKINRRRIIPSWAIFISISQSASSHLCWQRRRRRALNSQRRTDRIWTLTNPWTRLRNSLQISTDKCIRIGRMSKDFSAKSKVSTMHKLKNLNRRQRSGVLWVADDFKRFRTTCSSTRATQHTNWAKPKYGLTLRCLTPNSFARSTTTTT